MSQEIYSCVNLLEVTEVEKEEAMEQLTAFAKKYAAQKAIEKSTAALKAVWQTDIGGISRDVMEAGNANFTLCKLAVVEQFVEPIQWSAEKDAEFLAKLANGDSIFWTPPQVNPAPYHPYSNPW